MQMDERARKIIDAARETVRRVDRANLEWAEENERRDAFVPPLERTRPNQPSAPVTHDWVANGLDVLALTIGQEVGAIEARINAKIDGLERELGELRAERAVERAAVIDLPDWRRKHDAA
jgi:hypothetical protein